MAGPLAAIPWIPAAIAYAIYQIVIALGIGAVTYFGSGLVFDNLIDSVTSNYTNLGTDLLQLLTIFGIKGGIEMILGALAFRAAYLLVPRIGILGGSGS